MKMKLTPTQTAFVYSNANIRVIYSSFGEGKSFAAVFAMIVHAKRHGELTAVVIRDTLENIRTSVKPTMQEALGTLVRFYDSDRRFTIKVKPPVHGICLGIDDAASLSRLQGMVGASVFFLEEPAPIIYRQNAGLSEHVYNFALARSTRGNAPPLVMIAMNPADEEHWTYRRLIMEDDDPDFPLITKEVFYIPPNENPYLDDMKRQMNAMALKADPELYERYVLGRFSYVQMGCAVTPAYNPDVHRSSRVINPIKDVPGFRFYDAWFNPTVLVGQVLPGGRLIFCDTLIGRGIAMKQLIQTNLLPLLNSPKWRDKCAEWRDIGDPSMLTPDQSNVRMSTARVVEEMLDTRFEPGPSRWAVRREAVRNVFCESPDGKPAIVVCKSNLALHKALRGGWFYPKDNMGNPASDKPNKKNIYSHIGDAFSYGVSIMMPSATRKKRPRLQVLSSKRAASYATRSRTAPYFRFPAHETSIGSKATRRRSGL